MFKRNKIHFYFLKPCKKSILEELAEVSELNWYELNLRKEVEYILKKAMEYQVNEPRIES